jgi:hypothetical protein
MQLLNETLRSTIPPLHASENTKDPVIHAKFFDPCGSWTWYVLEFDGEDLFFGIVDGFEREWGYFSLAELESVRGKLGLGIERDLYFTSCLVSELPAKV